MRMTRNAFVFLLFLSPLSSFATVDSPVVQGLGGASRTGVAREAIFTNPAAVAGVTNTFGFFHYQLPKIPDFNAGGRGFSVGVYDGGDKNWKGGFGFSRTGKARIFNGGQGYIDRSEFRFSTGHAIMGNIIGGLGTRLTRIENAADTSRFFEADLGLLFPLFSDLRGGLTFENILNKEDESPQTVGVGAAYNIGYGMQLIADGYRLMSGTKSGERGWALAAEIGLTGDFTARAGLFEEAYRALKGWSVGASWAGPRASVDYALKFVGKGPREKLHVFGLTLLL